ncbi:aldehyde dehydrogenase family protein [Rhodopirellula sp. MGV]|uniref:aldehyde dehydrogenase family protein n=1 Tax=Rhodopirellula sp. MGV TaxID=2023130 RepID=UPI000B96AD90|nr:aldehyde dehydrogenase family protein [Rhodopirellula sp. MGV]OYP37741.1 betaine-aldehyde dehydrogenase [Rhodopirellula sp. MGV]PNY37178.1 aldehyde dehydrogenase family protein [Rhodopirellula baltica]
MSTTLPEAPKTAADVDVKHTECFIDGKWVPAVSGKTFATFNPATEQEIAQIAEGDAADVDAAAKAARHAFETGAWPKMDARDRGRLLYKLADRMEEDIHYLAALETLDNGKPLKDSLAADLPLAIDAIRYYAGYADKLHGSTIPIRGNYLCYTRREPIGVAGQIIPWNFPLLMLAWKWGPALAAGCTVVMKPAEQTPLTCLAMAQIAKEVGFPDGVINIVPGFGPTAGAACVKHPLIDKIAFTGEHRTAQIITRDSADTLKRLTFELGGKSPNVVFADADMDAAVQGAYIGLFLNQGQCCCAGSRVFVEKSCHDEFIEKLTALTLKRKVGDPFASDTDQGPQVDRAQFDKIMSYIDKGKNEGADCVAGGSRVGEQGYFVEPTIFNNVTDDMSIATDEIFGPVMSVLTFDDKEDMIRRANNTFYGLAAAVWTRDIANAHDFAARVRAGTVWVNCYDVFDAAAPFGGFKMSGYGRELGEEGLKPYTESKTVTVKL